MKKKSIFYSLALLSTIAGVVYLNVTHHDANIVSAVQRFASTGELPNVSAFSSRIVDTTQAQARMGQIIDAVMPAQKTAQAPQAKPILVAMQQHEGSDRVMTDSAMPISEPATEFAGEPLDTKLALTTSVMPEENNGKTELALDVAEMEMQAAEPVQDIRVLLVPDRETTIASTAAGRLVSLKGNLGQWFKTGELLASFDCDEKFARVDIAKAELSGALEEHEAKLKMQGLDQASDLEVALAASAANRAKAELKLNRTLASECRIYAPWSGRVAKAHVKNNMTVSAGEPLLDIVRTGPLKLKLNVPSIMLNQLARGQQFNVAIDETTKQYEAKVIAINSRVDSVSQTVEIEAKMTRHHKELLAGMSGTADL